MSDYFLNKIYDSLLSNKPVPKKPEPIVEKKESFKPLSKVYEILLKEVKHVALYGSKDDVNPKNIPDRSAQGLETLGVASQEVVKRVKKEINFEQQNVRQLIKDVLLKKANIRDVKGKAYREFERIMLNSEFIYIEPILTILKERENGFFPVISENKYYESYTKALEGAKTLLQEKGYEKLTPDQEQELLKIFFEVADITPKIAGTAVGKGEVFFSVFGDAKVSAEKGEAKSGDIKVGNTLLEIKATSGGGGARLGGEGEVQKGYTTVLQQIAQEQLKYTFSKQDIKTTIEILEYLKNKSNEAKTKGTSLEEFKNGIDDYIKQKNVREYLRAIQFNRYTYPLIDVATNLGLKTVIDLVRGDTLTTLSLPTSTSKKRMFIDIFINKLDNNIETQKKNLQASTTSEKITESKLNTFMFDILQLFKNFSNITGDRLAEIIAYVNNYEPNVVVNELKRYLNTDKKESAQNILQKYATGSDGFQNLTTLIGAMHFYSYVKHSGFKINYLLLLEVETPGKTLLVKAPTTIEEAIKAFEHPDIFIDASFDVPGSTSTTYAKSVNVIYRPS
jgi:hypothetical protein